MVYDLINNIVFNIIILQSFILFFNIMIDNDKYISSLIEQINKIKEERNKIEAEKAKKEEEEKKNKKERQEKLDMLFNQFNNLDNILNRNYIIKEEENKDNKIEYPKDENDEEEQYRLALKQSEEEAKRELEKIKEEEKQIQLAIEESKKYNINNNEIKEEEFDEEYGICPITQEYMENPVITPSGNYYEKTAIIDWINKNKNDPLTREYLTVDMLIEDNEYKKQIIAYRKKFNK